MPMTESLTAREALKIGGDIELEALLCKALAIEPLDINTTFREIDYAFKLMFPDVGLIVAEVIDDDGELTNNVYYAVFSSDDQLVEFKLRFL
jgi:hypothetical protein